MEKIKNIILDYGDVIFMIDFLKTQEAFTSLGIKNVSEIFGHRKQNSLFDDFDCGKISAKDFRNGIREISGVFDLSDTQIDDAWNSLLLGVTPGNHELLKELGQRYRLFLLSNNNEIHYQWIMEYLKKEFDLDDNSGFFEKDYYSHLLGMRKPNKEIFEYVLQQHNLDVEETIFIDDSPQHLDTAKQIGLKTYLLTKPDTIRDLLYREGIL